MRVGRIAVIASSFLLASTVQAGAFFPSRTVDIAFTGYCDGMRLVINQNSGIVTGNSTGCVSDPLVGTVGSLSRIGAALTVMSRNFMFVIDDAPRTWTIYSNADGSLISTGNYTVGAPELTSAGGPVATGEQ